MVHNFWQIDIGNIATWILTLLAILGAASRFLKKLDTFEFVQKQEKAAREKLEVMVNRINLEGTQFSRRGVEKEDILLQSNSNRINSHESALLQIRPDIAELKTNVEWIKVTLLQHWPPVRPSAIASLPRDEKFDPDEQKA